MNFKTTQNIFKDTLFFDFKEIKNNKLLLPEQWDYSRDLQIEDVDLWEVVYEVPLYYGIYASYIPYAEFYMIVPGPYLLFKIVDIETFYGPKSMQKLIERCKELDLYIPKNKKWVDSNDMWLY